MSIKLISVVFIFLASLSAGCAVEVRREATPSRTLLPVTGTASLLPAQAASATRLPPSPRPTPTPVDGATLTRVNVRAEPATTGSVLGMIPAETRVEITGQDPGGNWWQINYPQGVDGKGWVTAQYVTAPNEAEIPIVGGDATDPDQGNVAVVQQQLNVRSGPGTDFNSLGTLNAQDVVSLTGKDSNGAWLQIEFAAGPEGKGWINAAFVQAQGVENLPIIAETGQIVGTGTPTSIPPTPTATILPAPDDHDSATAPAASIIFEPTGTQILIYNGDLSSPQGDTDDWIAFKPYGPSVFISLECEGQNSVKIQMTENTSPVEAALECGDAARQIPVAPRSNYLVHLQAVSSIDRLQYTRYILTIKSRP